MKESDDMVTRRRSVVPEQITDLPGFRFLHAHHVSFPEPLQLVHAEYAIKLTLTGRGAPLRYRGAEYGPCSTGSITVFEPFEPVVSSTSTSTTSFATLLVEPDIVHVASDANDPFPGFEAPHIHHVALAQTLADIVRDIAFSRPRWVLEERVALALGLLLENRDTDNRPSVQRAVLRARELIMDRLSENVPLDELEQQVGLSRFHLARVFRKRFGLSPHQFRIHARVARARTLLAKGHSQVEAALKVGFFDQSHLHRHFRRIVGTTPGVFQRSVKSYRASG